MNKLIIAMAKGVFSDSSKMQPQPANIHANISGNINSHVGQAGQNILNSNLPPAGASTISEKINTASAAVLKNISQPYFWVWAITIVIIIFCAVFFWQKAKKEMNKYLK